MSEIAKQRVAPQILVDRLPDMAVEVAIGAFGNAERPVDVKGERPVVGFVLPNSGGPPLFRRSGPSLGSVLKQVQADVGRRASTSLRKASARWLIECFSAGSISPKVRSRPAGTNIGS